MLKHIMFVKY